jgi:tRNA pseudouridine13 synthase
MNFADLNYLHGKPLSLGVIKSKPEDFQVVEDLGYSPDGEGEHVLVRIRKQGCNTTFVAEAIAKYLKISSRDLSYAGMKDRHAVTEQTLCFRLPGKSMPDFSNLNLPGCDILSVARHQRKIRTGALAGNAFKIILREISQPQLLAQRLSMIEREGVPNYFGEQRFGHQQHNLTLARQWAGNTVQMRDKKKRGLLLSAVRSAFFNQVTSERLRQQGNLNRLMDGDAVQLVRSGSWFVAEEGSEEWGDIQQRLHQQQLRITGPLPGLNKKSVVNRALQLEQTILAKELQLLQLLEREKVEAARRALLVIPSGLQYEWLSQDSLQLQFWLPAGSYATSLVRELIRTSEV